MKDGHQNQCKPCMLAYHKKRRAERGDEIRAMHRRAYLARKERNPDIERAYWLKQKYNLTLAERDLMWVMQNHACAICLSLLDVNDLFVDHNHETGAVRGLLCINCNSGLGRFFDNPDFFQRAAFYLIADRRREG